MAEYKDIVIDGVKHRFPVDATDEEINSTLNPPSESGLQRGLRVARSVIPFGNEGFQVRSPADIEEQKKRDLAAGYTPGPSLRNLTGNIGRSLKETGQGIYSAFAHPIEGFKQDPVGEISNLSIPGSLIRGGLSTPVGQRIGTATKAGFEEAGKGGFSRHAIPTALGIGVSEMLGHGYWPGLVGGELVGRAPAFVRGFEESWSPSNVPEFKFNPNIARKYRTSESSGAAPELKVKAPRKAGGGPDIQGEEIEDPRTKPSSNIKRKYNVGQSSGEAPELKTRAAKKPSGGPDVQEPTVEDPRTGKTKAGARKRFGPERGSWSEKPTEELKVENPRTVKGQFYPKAKEEARIDRAVERGYEPGQLGEKLSPELAKELQDNARRVKATKMARHMVDQGLDLDKIVPTKELSNSIADGAGVNRPRDMQSLTLAVELARKMKQPPSAGQ